VRATMPHRGAAAQPLDRSPAPTQSQSAAKTLAEEDLLRAVVLRYALALRVPAAQVQPDVRLAETAGEQLRPAGIRGLLGGLQQHPSDPLALHIWCDRDPADQEGVLGD